MLKFQPSHKLSHKHAYKMHYLHIWLCAEDTDFDATIMLTWTVHSNQVRWKIGRARGPAKKFRALEIYGKEKNCYQLCFLLFNNNVYLKNNEDDYRKCVSMFINHKIAYDTHDMKMTPLSRCPSFVRSGGNATAFWCQCLPLWAVTVLKHYLSAFNSHMLRAQKNA